MSNNSKKTVTEILAERQAIKDVEINRINSIIKLLDGLSISKAEFVLSDCLSKIKSKTIINNS